MTTTWKLTGQPAGCGDCEHCGRGLVYRYEVTSTEGEQMIVGRGCLKSVTGWTLTAAQAAYEVRMIGVRARRAVNWAAFAATNPETAAAIAADCEIKVTDAYNPAPAVRLSIEDAKREAPAFAAEYMARRGELYWAA